MQSCDCCQICHFCTQQPAGPIMVIWLPRFRDLLHIPSILTPRLHCVVPSLSIDTRPNSHSLRDPWGKLLAQHSLTFSNNVAMALSHAILWFFPQAQWSSSRVQILQVCPYICCSTSLTSTTFRVLAEQGGPIGKYGDPPHWKKSVLCILQKFGRLLLGVAPVGWRL